ncbi:MAG TPA: fumarylacetoacetate hydrolase family protein [Thermomicrobiales bacterium]|nr:fumarylacetoacetate hydrolase family protein [Thermomicrobiales bacterium]
MRIVRFRDGSSVYWGIAREGYVQHMPDAPFWFSDDGEIAGKIDQLDLLTPVDPGKIVCVGLNYEAHVTERDPNRKVPTEPILFMKPPSALIGNGDEIRIANPDHETHHEAELVVVIGKRAQCVDAESSRDFVLGYTCGNDVSDRNLQAQDGQFVRAKGFDTYAPIGPWIETRLDPAKLKINCDVSGEIRQNSSTSNMIWGVDALISFISHVMTLEPGDIIMTGTPHGVSPLKSGDVCTIAIQGIGSLENPVRNRSANGA